MSKIKKIITAPTIKEIPSYSYPFLERFQEQRLWHIALLLILPFFVYIKTTGFLFINMDDTAIISNNLDTLLKAKNMGLAFKTDAFLSPHGDFYRPLQTLSFFMDTIVSGGKTWLYHLTSLIYHLLTVVSLYYLLRLLGVRYLTAFFCALLFSLHPVLASAVSWIPARGDVLLGLFGILQFSCFIKYVRSGKFIYLLLHLICFTLAICSKETAIILPILCLLYFWLIPVREAQNSGFKKLLSTLIPLITSWATIMLIFYLIRSRVVTGSPPGFIFGFVPFLKSLAALPTIAGKFFIPVSLSTLPLFNNGSTAIGCVVLILMLWMLNKFSRQKKWLFLIGMLWFVLLFIPPMFFKLYYSKFLLEYYEHRAYLPYAGLIICLAVSSDKYLFGGRSKLFTWLPLGSIVLFAFLSSAHSDDYKESNAFFSKAVEYNNPGAAVKRGEFYMEQRDYTNALNDFNSSIEMSNNAYPPAFYNRGLINSIGTKDHKAAEQDFTATLLLDTSYIDAYIKRAGERILGSNFQGALADLARAKQFDKNNVEIYYTEAKVYTTAQRFEEALPFYSKAIGMDSGVAEMYNDRAYALYRLQRYSEALQDCEKATTLFPQFLNAYYNKGMIYMEMNKPQVALTTFDTTLSLANNFYFGYFYRGMAKKKLNDMKGACEDWNQSVKLGFTLAQDTIRKYCK